MATRMGGKAKVCAWSGILSLSSAVLDVGQVTSARPTAMKTSAKRWAASFLGDAPEISSPVLSGETMSKAAAREQQYSAGRSAGRGSRPDSGFTLIELLIVMGILALLAALTAPQVLRYLGKARSETAKIQLTAIAGALELYALDNGAYPSPQIGLSALIEQPSGATRWNGPYLKKAEGLIDPWGRPYQYRVPGRSGAFEVFTLGRDNAPGGTGEDADVTN
jgi:general secretion pathway protein G